jgi:hypothetical protein
VPERPSTHPLPDSVAWRRTDMVFAGPGSLVAGSFSMFLVIAAA